MKSEENSLPKIDSDITTSALFELYMQFREQTQYFHGKRWKLLVPTSAKQNYNVFHNHCYNAFGSRKFCGIDDKEIRMFLIPFETEMGDLKKWEGVTISAIFSRMRDFYNACLMEFKPISKQGKPEANSNGQLHIPGLEPKYQGKPEPSKPQVKITSEELMGPAVTGRADGLGSFADVLDVMIKWAAESYSHPDRKHTGEFNIATKKRDELLDLYKQYIEAHIDRVSSS